MADPVNIICCHHSPYLFTTLLLPDDGVMLLPLCNAESITVITCDGRNLVGNLRGYDQTTNVVLDECHERVFSPDAGVEQVVLGLYIIRGDNM